MRHALKLQEKISQEQLESIFEKFSSKLVEGEKVLSFEDFKLAMTAL